MLQIRLRSVQSVEGVKIVPGDTVTVACPDHLILADLPVAKGLGSATAASFVKTVGRRSRRQLGERVHFCVRCDFPIAIYGRLSPCDHAFCLDCARSDSICYLCDERIQKIQTIKMMEGIFICAAPHCLKSFLKKTEFESHIYETHTDLLQRNTEKEDGGNDSEPSSAKQSAAAESTARAPPRLVLSPLREQLQLQPREQLPPRSIAQPKPPLTYFGEFQNQSETPFPDYPPPMMHGRLLPNFAVPGNSNPAVGGPPPFSFLPFPPEGGGGGGGGGLPFHRAPYEMTRPDSAPEVGAAEHRSLFSDGFLRSWNTTGSTGQGMVDHARPPLFFQGKYAESGADARDGKGILAPQPMTFPLLLPPPPGLPHLIQHDRDKSYWDHDRGRLDGMLHESSFRSGQDS